MPSTWAWLVSLKFCYRISPYIQFTTYGIALTFCCPTVLLFSYARGRVFFKRSWITLKLLIFTKFRKSQQYFVSGAKERASELTIDGNLVHKSDFDCVLCSRTLWRPVTTPCGHTYCRVCLDRCLDYSSSCPLCVKSLNEVRTQNSVKKRFRF